MKLLKTLWRIGFQSRDDPYVAGSNPTVGASSSDEIVCFVYLLFIASSELFFCYPAAYSITIEKICKVKCKNSICKEAKINYTSCSVGFWDFLVSLTALISEPTLFRTSGKRSFACYGVVILDTGHLLTSHRMTPYKLSSYDAASVARRLWLLTVLRPAQDGDVTIAGEGLQNLGLCLALRAFEQGGIFIVPHLLWHRTSVFPVSSEGPPHSVASCDTHRDAEDLFYPGSSQGRHVEKPLTVKRP
jgi:hypothetical protein